MKVAAGQGAFSPLTVISLVVIGVLSLAGLGVLSAYAPELKSGNDGGSHGLSKSSVGFGGIVRLLQMTGVPVVLSRGALGTGSEGSLLILTPALTTPPDQIADRQHRGPTLIVLPKWTAVAEQGKPGWVSTVGAIAPSRALAVLPDSIRPGTRIAQKAGVTGPLFTRPAGDVLGPRLALENLQTISGREWIPVVIDDRGAAVVALRRGTQTYVLSDPDLLNTQGLKRVEGAQVAVEILDIVRADGEAVVFDLTLNGFQRTRSLLRLMLEPPLLGVTLVIAALFVVAGLQAGARFGPAREKRRAVALGKQALAENTAGLVRLAQREHRMASPYAVLVRAAVARAIGAPRHLSEAELDAFLDRVGTQTGTGARFSTLATRAAEARTAGDLMAVARDLHRWKLEMTHGHQ
ncbi:DUF4350 domain-containing protein [Brevundimonas variabilis]|uniref:DUF4350 domain-containing protein n=1 Tax=Brevundimonas variabilis TaxID=74312 RepID=A0A7W9CHR3_9CAUL|nr:DUF4350 domain-containing protein [Brevundimonas variabilis]MBB5745804.1 hypothetical protein [Brevundimonas variabilis]